MYRIERVINNNVISAREGEREVILTGRGLGFGRRAGDTYDPAKIERRFVLEDATSAVGFTSGLAELPYEVLVLSNEIADYLTGDFGLSLSAPMQLALADHIQFAIERLAAGQHIENSMLWELKGTYPREFAAAVRILGMVRDSTGVGLPVDEAGFITMHLVNANLTGDMAATVGTASAVQEIVSLVAAQLGMALDPASLAYARFLTHIKFAVARIEEGQLLEGSDNGLYDTVRLQDPLAHEVALAIAGYVRRRYEVDLPDDELLYLMLHVNRLRTRADA